MEPITGDILWELVKHLKQWLINLSRASDERKAQSKVALRAVIIASRNTAAYLTYDR